jgi:hypothetical protein
MKEMMRRTIETLKEKVKENLMNIQNNQKEIRELLKEPVSNERSEKLEQRYALNKVLLAENNDFINVQLTLTNFIDKYNNTDVFEHAKVENKAVCLSESECFTKTVNGDLPYNHQHPLYNDENFFQKLLAHYQTVEDYETCSRLMNEKNS